MSLAEIQALIEARVSQDFAGKLYEALRRQHKKHGFKTTCQCHYCDTKRRLNKVAPPFCMSTRSRWLGISSFRKTLNASEGGL